MGVFVLMHQGLDGREVRFAQRLASNELKTRNQTLKKLETFLGSVDESISDEELLKLWKGLFYCLWLSDKVPVQQELATKIGKLIHCFSNPVCAFQFLKCFFITLNIEWHGLDHHRLDKFYSLQRRVIEESLKLAVFPVLNASVNEPEAKDDEEEDEEDEDEDDEKNVLIYYWSDAIQQSIDEDTAPGIVLHLVEVFIPSLFVALPDGLNPEIFGEANLIALLVPFFSLLQSATNSRVFTRVYQEIFRTLLTKTVEDPEPDLTPEEEENELTRHLHHVICNYEFGAYFNSISEALLSVASNKETPEKNRTKIFELREKFQKMLIVPESNAPVRGKKVYKPLTSEEAAAKSKKRKKKRAI